MAAKVLIIGSAPDSLYCRDWKYQPFDAIIAINNAWQVRSDWTHSIFPEDFPKSKHARPKKGQVLLSSEDYVQTQNEYGGFVYAGGTMAFTAPYWVLARLKPKIIAFIGCDMIYEGKRTHFYGKGTADPLREDITLKNLLAKSARIEAFASLQNCAVINLSQKKSSNLIFPRKPISSFLGKTTLKPRVFNAKKISAVRRIEEKLAYFEKSGKYWKKFGKYLPEEIDKVDKLWLDTLEKI